MTGEAPSNRNTAQSILAIHPGALGDLVLFARLLDAFGGGATLVAGGEKGRLLKGLGVVERALDFESLPMHEVFASSPPGQCRLPSLWGRFERLISCFGGGDARAQDRLALLAGARRAAFLPIRPPAEFRGHLLDLWADELGIPRVPSAGAWPVPQSWREDAAAVLSSCTRGPAGPYCVIHPGAGAESKRWPLERFVETARLLDAQKRGRPVFVLGPVEMDRWADAAAGLARECPVVRCLPVETLAGLLAGARLYLGNDSGVSHLSAAVGTPTIAIFQEATLPHFRPLGPRVWVVAAPAIEGVTVERVRDAASSLLRRRIE